MTKTGWTDERIAIRVVRSSDDFAAIAARARDCGAVVLTTDLREFDDPDSLLDDLGSKARIPYPARGPDAAIDWLSELDWLSTSGGVLMIFEGLDEAVEAVRSELVDISPFVLDRWREAEASPYNIVFVADEWRDETMAHLEKSNTRLDEVGRNDTLTFTAAVPVIVDT